MTRKLTLGFKKEVCQRCKSCDLRALRKGWDHCGSSYKPRTGHCENFTER